MKILNIRKEHTLLLLAGLLMVGIIFSVIQVTKAGVTGPHNPGHTWAQLDKPGDCASGLYVYGADDSGWLCRTDQTGGGTLVQTTDYTDCAGSFSCTVYCPSGYIRSGCSARCDDASGIEECSAYAYGDGCRSYCEDVTDAACAVKNTVYIYCIKI